MKVAIVIASRLESRRIPQKALREINGKPLIEHLVDRCLDTDLPVVLAAPRKDAGAYADMLDGRVRLTFGYDDDPLARLDAVAEELGLDAVIRVCHDKVFIDSGLVRMALDEFERRNLDYLYSSSITAGAGFEIISAKALCHAASLYKNVEHVSYAIKAVTKNHWNWVAPLEYITNHRLLVDYPEDLTLLDLVLSQIGNDGSLLDAIELLNNRPFLSQLNKMPDVTVYTCAYNADRWIDQCMRSVVSQSMFAKCEYLLIDDCSTDRTPLLMAEAAAGQPKISFIRNQKNLGLASSSNVALAEARGKYIVRLDADDYFLDDLSLYNLWEFAALVGADAVYPANQRGDERVQWGDEQHHVGGAMFRRGAVNHIKFTDGLRGYEGLDLFTRAKEQLSVSYLNRPIFFYRQHDGSMSKNNLEERAKIKAEIESRV